MPLFPSVLACALVSATAAAQAPLERAMAPYVERIPGTAVEFSMAPVPGGTYTIGSDAADPRADDDERPLHEVRLEPFWIGTHEVTWNEYRLFMLGEAPRDAAANNQEGAARIEVDVVARPTPAYVPMDFGMGTDGFPAISMTQLAARQYTKWLSKTTGRYYRLPSEAEWEAACRAGATEPADASELARRAWSRESSGDRYHRVGELAPNTLGIYDLLGNVAEWTLDQYAERYREGVLVAWPDKRYPRVVRGGSWRDPLAELRCAARRGSSPAWQRRDPQLPKSIWYLTDAPFVGFRVVHPLREPSEEETERAWEPDVAAMRAVLERQLRGER